MSNNEKTFDDLLNLMLVQAKTFLEEMGTFHPYGSVLDIERKVITLGVYDDKEINTQEVIKIISDDIIKSIENKEILIGAIGIDVIISNTRENGIMIRVTDDGIEWHERTYPYIINKEGVDIRSKKLY